MKPPAQRSLLHIINVSYPQPVALGSSAKSSSTVHKRAPEPSQKSRASNHVTWPLHPPRLVSLSPHTRILPCCSALPQPKSLQFDAEIVTILTEALVGAGMGTIGLEVGSSTGLEVGTGVGSGKEIGVGASVFAQQRTGWVSSVIPHVPMSVASHQVEAQPAQLASDSPHHSVSKNAWSQSLQKSAPALRL